MAQPEADPDPNRPVELLNANVLEYEEREGRRIRKLIGNVQLKQDSTLFFCDLAYQYEDSNVIDARQNVRVLMADGVRLAADRLVYFGSTKIVELYQNIRLTQGPNTLTTNRMTYFRVPAYGHYQSGGTLRDTANTLTSVRGYYFTRTRNALFSEHVNLEGDTYGLTTDSLVYNTRSRTSYFVKPTHITTEDNEQMYTEGGFYDGRMKQGLLFGGPPWFRDAKYFLKADTIFYDDSLDYGWARCNLLMVNSDSSIWIRGDTGAFFRNQKEVFVADNPSMIYYMETDTLQMYADTLFAIDDTVNQRRILRGYYNVRIFMRGVQAIADSAEFDRIDSVFRFYRDPVLWSSANQVSGDTIRLFLKNQAADSLAVLGRSFVISEETPNRYFNQVRGRNLFADIDSNAIRYLQVVGNAESIYFARDGEALTGMNHATSIDMEVFLEANRPKRIRFLRTPRGTFYPMHEIFKKPNKLEGFAWRVAERPRNYLDTAGWTITPASAWAPHAESMDTACPDCNPANSDSRPFLNASGNQTDASQTIFTADTLLVGPPAESGTESNPRTSVLPAAHAHAHPEAAPLTPEARKAMKAERKIENRARRKAARTERQRQRVMRRYEREQARLRRNSPAGLPMGS